MCWLLSPFVIPRMFLVMDHQALSLALFSISSVPVEDSIGWQNQFRIILIDLHKDKIIILFHAYNSSYPRGREWEDGCLKPMQANSLGDHLKNNLSQEKSGRMSTCLASGKPWVQTLVPPKKKKKKKHNGLAVWLRQSVYSVSAKPWVQTPVSLSLCLSHSHTDIFSNSSSEYRLTVEILGNKKEIHREDNRPPLYHNSEVSQWCGEVCVK
jgi:hypothetical protein